MRRLTILLAVALVVVPAFAQTIDPATEGFDPMRQISTQFVRPNLLIVLDVSGSMADDINGTTVGVDHQGLPEWTSTSSTTGCSGSRSRWTYQLNRKLASRMVTVKNALGNSVTMYEWSAPASYPAYTGWTYLGGNRWQSACLNSRPSAPFRPIDAPGLVSFPPADLIGKSASLVNWGLEIYSGSVADCTTATLKVKIDSNDTGDASALEAQLRLSSAGGLGAGGYTPTRGALAFAKTVLDATATGGSLTDKSGVEWTFTADPKVECGRTYGVILVTDGLSNSCNTNGKNWREPCCSSYSSSTAPPCYSDVGSSGTTCPADPNRFPAGNADELWKMTAGGTRLRTRTWVVGVSPLVGPCELDYTAYKGRTDASSPNDDAGFTLNASHNPTDPYLPADDGDASSRYDGPTETTGCSTHAPTHGHYAYFAETSAALKDAFNSILGALGVGDYTTSPPAISSAPTSGTAIGASVYGYVISAEYPGWQGHLYAYDLRATCDPDKKNRVAGVGGQPGWDCGAVCGYDTANYRAFCRWDAGETLSIGGIKPDATRKGANNGYARRIYTWDPASANEMIQLSKDAAVVNRVNTLCGGCLGADVATATRTMDFILGGDGSGGARTWKLGALVNSTPAISGPPEIWRQGTLEPHTDFETEYQGRHRTIWAGGSDGMLHGFDTEDGVELVALVPPDLLPVQKTLSDNYQAKPASFPVGQRKAPTEHVYGVANSPRLGEVWDDVDKTYKTVLFLTEGPGGAALYAFDVTHPFPGRDYNADGDTSDDGEAADPNYGFAGGTGPAVKTMWGWTRSGIFGTGAMPHLGQQSWSVPALGASATKAWQLFLGAGFDETLTPATAPRVFRLNPATGAIVREQDLLDTETGALVRNQSFADAVVWQTTAPYFAMDNVVNEGIQADLNGRLWSFAPSLWTKEELLDVGVDQPLYYPPAVARFPSYGEAQYQIYAFSSGTFYEKSPNVTGADIGVSGAFIPKIYIAVRDADGNFTTWSKAVNTLKSLDESGAEITLGRYTQVASPPMVLTPRQGAPEKKAVALFLLYDPDATDCVGKSYIVKVDFDPGTVDETVIPPEEVYDVGKGAAGGFAIAGETIQVSQSDPGYDDEPGKARAFIKPVPRIRISQGGEGGQVRWWIELQ